MNIIFLDCTQNYGYRFSAANTKVEFLAKGLQSLGNNCTIINGLVGYERLHTNDVQQIKGVGHVITYPKKCNQLISWTLNLPKLIRDLKKLYNKRDKNIIVLEAPDLHLYLIYTFLSRIFKYKIVVISHEWTPTISSTHILRKPFNYLYSISFGYFVDGILPISEFIIKRIKHFKKPYIKIPIIAEYETIKEINKENKYFLYCVYAVYKRTIIPIIDAFNVFYKNINEKDTKLILVLSGSDKDIEIIKNHVKEICLESNIIIKTKIPFEELIQLYSSALALIIPLDPSNKQDEARFSQKIAEYLSSGTPIISNNVGEIKYYFKNKENIILNEYSIKGFAESFKWVIDHQNEAKKIGINGFQLGKEEFDFRNISKELDNFLQLL